MVDTLHLQPPGSGLSSDPILFGVAEALARLFPVEETNRQHDVVSSVDIHPAEGEQVCNEDGLAA